MAQSKRFSPMRYTAATEEAAVAGALDIVGATRDDADYEVLDVSAKGVTVRIKPREAGTSGVASAADVGASAMTPPPVVEIPTAAEVDEAEPVVDDEDFEVDSEIEAQLEVDDADAPTLAETNEAFDADEDDESDPVVVDEAEGYEADDIEEETDLDGRASVADSEPEPVAVSEDVIAAARATAQEFLDKMGLDADCIYESGATSATVPLVIEGEDVGILIGKHGATLQAFQYLVNLTVNNGNEPDSGVRVVVDAGNYRARRQNSLEQTARAAAQRARTSGRPVRLDAMPASERRIIHMFLQNEAGITTQSEGREPQRRLVIFPSQGSGNASAGSGGSGRYEDRGSGERRGGMGGFNRGRGGRGYRR